MERKKYIYLAITLILSSIFLVGSTSSSAMKSVFVSASNFVPASNTCLGTNNGVAIQPSANSTSGGCSDFNAPVSLPDGATIKKMTFYWVDTDSDHDGSAQLMRISYVGNVYLLAQLMTNGSTPGFQSSSTDASILVDNTGGGYIVHISLPNTSFSSSGVVIEYTYESFLSSIFK